MSLDPKHEEEFLKWANRIWQDGYDAGVRSQEAPFSLVQTFALEGPYVEPSDNLSWIVGPLDEPKPYTWPDDSKELGEGPGYFGMYPKDGESKTKRKDLK